MPLSEEQIILDYQKNRINLENKEDETKAFQRRGEQEIEQVFSELAVSYRNQEMDGQMLSFLRQETYRAQETYTEIVQHEKNKCLQQLEDNELDYRRKLSQID